LLILIDGDIAIGGGDFTVVSALEFEVTVLLDVDSVTMGSSAIVRDVVIIKLTAIASFLYIF